MSNASPPAPRALQSVLTTAARFAAGALGSLAIQAAGFAAFGPLSDHEAHRLAADTTRPDEAARRGCVSCRTHDDLISAQD